MIELLNIQHPIIQAPMAGGITTPELVSAVSNCGALGSLGAAYLSPKELRSNIRKIKQLTSHPFLVNIFVPPNISAISTDKQTTMCELLNYVAKPLNVHITPVDPPYLPDVEEQISILIAEKPSIVSFIFGILDSQYIQQLKKNNILIIGTATNLNEANQLVAAGVDAIIAQGIEAGGHRGVFNTNAVDPALSTLTLTSLLSTTLEIPIIAAGGIASKEHIKAAMAHGATACQLGTAFITTHESAAHSCYKKILLSNHSRNTTLTRAFSGRPARSIINTYIEIMKEHENNILPFPIQNKLTKLMRQAAAKQHNPEFMSLWSGVNYASCQAISVAKLIHSLKL